MCRFDALALWYIGTVKTITVSSTGRLTLPAEVRRALGLEGETELEVEVDDESEEIILRPAVVLRREDAWAYTPEHRALLSRAHADSREGRVREVSEDELRSLG
jgi:AbrB family looped-hinge helix DNA binding protein